MKTRIFIGSSTESEMVAKLVKKSLEPEFECVVWKDNFFEMNESTYDNLIKKAMGFDYAVFVGGKDDRVSRLGRWKGRRKYAPRDNVYLELGLYAGILTKERTFFVLHKSVTVASDLMGITLLHYKNNKDVERICGQIRQKITAEEKLSRISFLPSTSLAIGYFYNFLVQVADVLCNLETVEIAGKTYPVKDDGKRIDVIIPESVEIDWQSFAKEFYRVNHGVNLDISGTTRKLEVKIDFEALSTKQELKILEVPQTMRSAFYAVELASGKNFTGNVDYEIEAKQKEVRNFVRTLENLINNKPHVKERVEIKMVDSCNAVI